MKSDIFRTPRQKQRDDRNSEMLSYYKAQCKENPLEKKTSIIKMCAEKYKLTYSATRLILVRGGVYRSKQ